MMASTLAALDAGSFRLATGVTPGMVRSAIENPFLGPADTDVSVTRTLRVSPVGVWTLCMAPEPSTVAERVPRSVVTATDRAAAPTGVWSESSSPIVLTSTGLLNRTSSHSPLAWPNRPDTHRVPGSPSTAAAGEYAVPRRRLAFASEAEDDARTLSTPAQASVVTPARASET